MMPSKLAPRRCEECKRYYQPRRKDARFCEPACRKRYRGDGPTLLERRDAHIQRVAEVLRKDPDLEAWQIRERFGELSGSAIIQARRLAGVAAPEPSTRGRRIV